MSALEDEQRMQALWEESAEDDDEPLSPEALAELKKVGISPQTDEETTLGEDGVERIYSKRHGRMKLCKGLVAAYYNEGNKEVTWQLGQGRNRTDFIHILGETTEDAVRAQVLQMHEDPTCAVELLELDENDRNWASPDEG